MSTLKVDTIQGKTTAGTIAMPAGHIVQVARTYTADASHINTSSTSLVASGFQCSITPKFSSSLIHLEYFVPCNQTSSSHNNLFGFKKTR